jgi:ketosteroid isomerase-like protein
MALSDIELLQVWMTELADRGVEDRLDYLADNMWDADIDWRAIEGAPDDVGEIHGRDRMRRYVADWYEMFDDLTLEPEEYLDAGEGRVVVVQCVSGRAKASGVPTELRYAVVYTIRDGKVVRGREYLTRELALEAIGLTGADVAFEPMRAPSRRSGSQAPPEPRPAAPSVTRRRLTSKPR